MHCLVFTDTDLYRLMKGKSYLAKQKWRRSMCLRDQCYDVGCHPWHSEEETQGTQETQNTNSQMTLNRGSYMSAHVLLNLLNELGKRDKMRGLPSILSLFRNEFNNFNKTRTRMLDSIYHMALRLL